MLDPRHTGERLHSHLTMLTQTIGERSVSVPENLAKSASYILSFYNDIHVPAHFESYEYHGLTVHNVVAELITAQPPAAHYLLGAHYDSVTGTVGADDNASAIAVQLETARELASRINSTTLNVAVTFVSFALEEPPVYGSRYMGSRVYAAKARREKMRIDGMICLEMVGYTCGSPGCQRYPFPLMFFNYPKEGNFIGIVGNTGSRSFARKLKQSFAQNPDLPVISLTVPFNGRILPAVRLSDHASFWDKGYPAVMVTDTAFFRNPHYHMHSDTIQTLDINFMAQLVKSLIGFFCSHR